MRLRRGRRSIAVLLVVVVVLGGLLAADRLLHAKAEQEVSRILAAELGLKSEPTVDIRGFPFLTQVVTNRFGQVDLSGRDITAGTEARPLVVEQMDLSLRRVVTADGYRTVTAGELDGTAYVTWAEISRQLGARVTPQEGGRVRVDLTVDLYGQFADFVLSAKPVLDVPAQEIRLVEPQVLIARYRVPADVVNRIAAEYAPPVPIALPLSLRASSFTVTTDYLELGLTGSDVELLGS